MLPGDTPQQLPTAAGILDQTAQFTLPAPVPFWFCFRCRAGIKIVSASIHLQRDEKHTVKYQHGRLNGSGPRMRENADTKTPIRDKSYVTFFQTGNCLEISPQCIWTKSATEPNLATAWRDIWHDSAVIRDKRTKASSVYRRGQTCSAVFPIKSLLGTLQRALRRIRWPLLKMYPFS